MILSLNDQATLFLLMVLMGAIIGALYDAIRIFRKMIPHGKLVIQAEDGIYWLIVVFFMFYILLKRNQGEIRFFILMGAFLGMGLYFLTLSPLVNAVSDKIIFALRWVIRLFLEIIFTPFRLLYLIFRGPAKKTKNFVHKKTRKVLHFGKRYAKMNTKAFLRNMRILIRKK